MAAGVTLDLATVDGLRRELGCELPVIVDKSEGKSEALETAKALTGLEPALSEDGTAAVAIYGDGPGAPAAALVAVKLGVPAVRLGAGVRSGERRSPEEINRVVTDRVCDLLLCGDEASLAALRREGLADRTKLVGDWEADPEPAAGAILAWLDT